MTMRKSQRSTSRSPTRTLQHSRSQSRSCSPLQPQPYFCHYRNAVYMGTMKYFQKHGLGLLLHDDGTSSICNHYHDTKHGHNITYGDNWLVSSLYEKGRAVESVYRAGWHLLSVKYNKDMVEDGWAVLLDYRTRAITYVLFRKGRIVERREEAGQEVSKRVFDMENLQFLVGIAHTKALRYQVPENPDIASQQSNNKLTISFVKKGLMCGLGFSAFIRQSTASGDSVGASAPYFFRTFQRGYFHDNQLNGMGEKWFKNGNYYMGEFKDNLFEGKGLLKNAVKNNWVHANFQAGSMTQLIEYSHEGDEFRFNKIVELMHERKNNWISKEIMPENPEIYERLIEKIVTTKQGAQIRSLQERKLEVLKKIQQNFQLQEPTVSSFEPNAGSSYNQVAAQQRKKKPTGSYINKQPNLRFYRNENSNSIDSPPAKYPEKQPQSPEIAEEAPRPSPYKLRLYEVNNSQRNRKSAVSPAGTAAKNNNSSAGLNQSRQEQTPNSRSDSRIVGKSRVFKYIPNEAQESPPPFILYSKEK